MAPSDVEDLSAPGAAASAAEGIEPRQDSADKDTSCPLLDSLPPEIRDMIWGYALPTDQSYKIAIANRNRFAIPGTNKTVAKAFQEVDALKATSRQIRAEALAVFVRENTFMLLTLPPTIELRDFGDPEHHLCRPGPRQRCWLMPMGPWLVEHVKNFTIRTHRFLSKYKKTNHVPYAWSEFKVQRKSDGRHIVNIAKLVELDGCSDIDEETHTLDEGDKRLERKSKEEAVKDVAHILDTKRWSTKTLAEVLRLIDPMGMPVLKDDVYELGTIEGYCNWNVNALEDE